MGCQVILQVYNTGCEFHVEFCEETLPYSIRSSLLSKRIQERSSFESMVDRGYLCMVFAYSFSHVDPGVSTTLSNRLHQLEKEIKRDHVSHSLQHRPELEDLVRRGIQCTIFILLFSDISKSSTSPFTKSKGK